MRPLTVSAAIADPNLLGAAFAGASWDTWRAVLRAAEGLPLSADQHDLFQAVAERDPPPGRVKELWVVAGRRAGKDSVASAIATVLGVHDYRRYLRPGERASILCLAVDRQQAKIVNRYIKGYFEQPLLKQLVIRETEEGLELNNNVEIVVATNSFRQVRGRTVVCAILDELAFFRSEDSANPDVETYNALSPSLTTIPNALLIGISSPYRRAGLLYDKWKKHYGAADPDILVVKGASRTFNPTLPQKIVDQALERDPEAAAAEWLGEWRNDLAQFIDRAVIESALVPGRHELPPLGERYVGFVDPLGRQLGQFHAGDSTSRS